MLETINKETSKHIAGSNTCLQVSQKPSRTNKNKGARKGKKATVNLKRNEKRRQKRSQKENKAHIECFGVMIWSQRQSVGPI